MGVPSVASKAPYSTQEGPLQVYGEVQGSQPGWATSCFADRGRRHVPELVPTHFGKTGFAGWYAPENVVPARAMVRPGEGKPSPSGKYSEPTIQNANRAYFGRRALAEDDVGYRRCTRQVPAPQQVDRPQGRRFIPEPFGAPPRTQGIKAAFDVDPNAEPATMPEPNIPRLNRTYAPPHLRAPEPEPAFDRATGKKMRVDRTTHLGTGRAGDLSQSYAPLKRPEDTGTFFKSFKDSPTFTRFVASLPPPPAASPHQRRAEALQRLHAAEMSAERALVATLTLPDDGAEDGAVAA